MTIISDKNTSTFPFENVDTTKMERERKKGKIKKRVKRTLNITTTSTIFGQLALHRSGVLRQ